MKATPQMFRCMLLCSMSIWSICIPALDLFAQELAVTSHRKKITGQPESYQGQLYEPLNVALNRLKEKHDIYFMYKGSKIKQRKVRVDPESEAEVEAKLKAMLKPANLTFRKVGNIYIISEIEVADKRSVILPETGEHVTERRISGKVNDEKGEVLPGVNILIKGTQQGTTTDSDGIFFILVPDEEATLVFSFVGYTSQEVVVGNRTNLEIKMLVDTKALDELVVVGYGVQKKSDLTGSVASVSADQLDKQGAKVHILQALQGLVPGLNIRQTSNSASQSSFDLQIRGTNSIKASNSPLIILDGVPYSGGLSSIDQGDISSVEVLKDASSAAIYGSRGANGVIIITTKKGTVGRPSISVDGSYGIQQIRGVPPVLTGSEFYQFAVERVGQSVVDKFPTIVGNHKNNLSTDWIDLATRTGIQQKYSIKVSGGVDKAQYFVSGTYTDVKGIARGDNFKNFTGRVNLSVNITDWLKLGTNSQFTYIDDSGVPAQFSDSYMMNPLVNPFNEDGSYAIFPWPEEPTSTNPLLNLNILDEDYSRRLFSNNYLEINFPFVKGLSYRINTGLHMATQQTGQFWGGNTLIGLNNGGRSYTQDAYSQDFILENIVSYQKTVGSHQINFTGLYSSQRIKSEIRSLTAQRFPTDFLTWYQPQAAAVINPSASFSERSYVSQMARVFYSYAGKYLITFTTRRDGYSGFGKDNKFGVFPSVALGWNISDERFMSSVTWLSDLKIRASYGKNGNEAITPYQTLSRLTTANFLGGSNADQTAPGYYPATLASPTLSWETSRTINLGLDFQLMKSRISGALDVYRTNTRDLLLDRSIPSTHGITTIAQNIGETENRGVELLIRTRNIEKGDFSWSTDLSFSNNRNQIIDLYGDKTDDVANQWFIGKPIGINFNYQFDGVWQVGESNELQPDAKPGDVKIRDVNGDGVISANDRTFIGQSTPTTIFGLGNTLNYKRLSLNFFFNSNFGATRVNPLWDTDIVYVDARRNTIKLNWWNENNPTNEYPANRNFTNPYALRFYHNANFIRLRDVTLSYSFPDEVARKVGARRISTYGNIKNAFVITPFKGMDPELSDQRGIPQDRMFLFGVNIEL